MSDDERRTHEVIHLVSSPSPRSQSTVPASAFTSRVQRLLSRHHLGSVASLQPLAGGQLNAAVRVNDEYVLRCREATRATGSLLREAELLPALRQRGVATAEVVASGLDDL